MIRTVARATPFALAALLVAAPASAQIVQSLQFGAGGFFPKGIDSRVSGDVLVANLNQPVIPDTGFDEPVTASLAFDMDDFHGWTLFGEWNIAFGARLELGLGASYYSQKVDSRYRDLEHGERPSQPDITQEIGLRVLPLTTVLRFMPFGGPSNFQPYFGGGMGILNFRYSEIGEFVDPVTFEIFPGHFTKTGTTVGPLVLGGLRMPIGGDIYALTFEARYQWGSGDTGGAANEFLGDKIDLGGGSINFGFLVRF
jgi:hypothetical protein